MSKTFDVIVIGAGPGGYVAAIRAAQLGKQVACIDEWKNASGGPAPGGTCTNVGCIPSKALLQSSEHFEHANHHFADHGISAKDVKMDVAKMLSRKDTVVKQNNEGILYLFKKNKVTFFHGRGSFASQSDHGYEVKVVGASEESLIAKHVIVATGSSARALPGVPFDEEHILSNDGALRIGAVPKQLAIIGSGVIGLEMGSVWRRLGAEVTVLEAAPQLMLAQLDTESGDMLRATISGMGMKVLTSTITTRIIRSGDQVTRLDFADGTSLDTDMVVVSAGIRPITEIATASGLTVNKGIVCNDQMQTSDPDVFALGECVEHRGATYGLVEPIWGMANVLADVITGTNPNAAYLGSKLGTKLKVMGVELASMGETRSADDGDEVVVYREPRLGIYKKLIVRNDRIAGAILLGETEAASTLMQMFMAGSAVPDRRADLFFGSPTGVALLKASDLPDNAQICNCNGPSGSSARTGTCWRMASNSGSSVPSRALASRLAKPFSAEAWAVSAAMRRATSSTLSSSPGGRSERIVVASGAGVVVASDAGVVIAFDADVIVASDGGVIVLGAEDPETRRLLWSRGAPWGVLPMEVSAEELCAAVRAVAAGREATDGILAFNNRYVADALTGSARLSVGAKTSARLAARWTAADYHYPTNYDGSIADRNAQQVEHRFTASADVAHQLTDATTLHAVLTSNEFLPRSNDGADSPADTLGFYGFFARSTRTRRIS